MAAAGYAVVADQVCWPCFALARGLAEIEVLSDNIQADGRLIEPLRIYADFSGER